MAEVDQFTDGSFYFDTVADGEFVEGQGHFSAPFGWGRRVNLDEKLEGALLVCLRDGCVSTNDNFGSRGVFEFDHEMLSGREAKGLEVVVEFKGEDASIP